MSPGKLGRADHSRDMALKRTFWLGEQKTQLEIQNRKVCVANCIDQKRAPNSRRMDQGVEIKYYSNVRTLTSRVELPQMKHPSIPKPPRDRYTC